MSEKQSAVPPLASLFHFDPQGGLPIHVQLRQQVAGAILGGRLAPGSAMPSTRELAQALSLSRNTVTAAYQQLVDDGYLESRPRKGLFVAADAQPASAQEPGSDPFRRAQHAADAITETPGPDWDSRILRSLSARPTLAKPENWKSYPYQFVYGTHDARLFPTDEFRECCSRTLRRVQMPLWTPDLEAGDVPELVDQIRQRLLPRRGVFARADEVLITIGSQQSFYLLAEAFFGRGTRVGLEEPGHPHARNSFALRGPQLLEIAVDAEGVQVDALPALDYLFVTPSHQSPTTAMLSLERRQWLLRKAELQDFVIIEDDYEAESLYEGTPMPALKSLDRSGRVIYIGSFSKALSPAVRLGYIVAPAPVVAELRVLRHAMVRHPSAFLQHAYALFLSLGYHDSHSRRVNLEVQQRLQVVGAALNRHLPQLRFSLPQAGASLWVQMPSGMDGAALAQAARAHGVLVEAGDVFFATPPVPCPYIRLRLSSIPIDHIEPGIRALARAARELQPTTSKPA